MTYQEYLQTKPIRNRPRGLDATTNNPALFAWQKAVVDHCLHLGVAGMFEECGLGKTAQQLAWAREVAAAEKRPVLVVAPLAVSRQTRREGRKFGIDVTICEADSDVQNGVNITNYEKLERFDATRFCGVVLDESSILKSYMGKTKRLIVEKFCNTPYKLAATATPAPNDLMELLNHAEFLGVMKSSEALGIWFAADQSQSGRYVLKGHAEADFWAWVASWAVCIEKPSDIGHSDEGYRLPDLHEEDVVLPVSELNRDFTQGMFREVDMSATGFYKERRRTTGQRAEKCAEIAMATSEQVLIWCGTNEEADALKALLPQAVEVRGGHTAAHKEAAALGFADGSHRVLISKPSIFGYGMNFQNCHQAVYCGLDYSFEGYYQSVRRLHRFGQRHPVHVWRVMGSTERNILAIIERKQRQKQAMAYSMATHMKDLQSAAVRRQTCHLEPAPCAVTCPGWLRSEAS